MNKHTIEKIKVYRIIDSPKEKFNITGPYRERVEVINIITAPEIEMLVIHAENKYDHYSKKNVKPSIYVKEQLAISNVKSFDFVKEYFANVEKLIYAIEKYHQKTKKKENTLLSLLK